MPSETVPQSVPELETPYGEAGDLVLDLITASMDANFKTMDSLYEGEREHRQALEVLVADVLDALDDAWGGTAREYEAAVRPLRMGACGRMAELAARHPDHDRL